MIILSYCTSPRTRWLTEPETLIERDTNTGSSLMHHQLTSSCGPKEHHCPSSFILQFTLTMSPQQNTFFLLWFVRRMWSNLIAKLFQIYSTTIDWDWHPKTCSNRTDLKIWTLRYSWTERTREDLFTDTRRPPLPLVRTHAHPVMHTEGATLPSLSWKESHELRSEDVTERGRLHPGMRCSLEPHLAFCHSLCSCMCANVHTRWRVMRHLLPTQRCGLRTAAALGSL